MRFVVSVLFVGPWLLSVLPSRDVRGDRSDVARRSAPGAVDVEGSLGDCVE